MRRSFRLGLRFGVLVGVLVALVKVVQSRRGTDAAGPAASTEGSWTGDTSWTPPPPPVAVGAPEPAVAKPEPAVAPAAPAPDLEPALAVAEPEPAVAVAEPAVAKPGRPRTANRPLVARPAAPAKKAAKATRARKVLPAEVWVEPTGSTCPSSHPVKAKLASRLFHLPGMFAYDRTRPDRCYSGADTAVADGFVQAKR